MRSKGSFHSPRPSLPQVAAAWQSLPLASALAAREVCHDLDKTPVDQQTEWAPLLHCLQRHGDLDESTLLEFGRNANGVAITKYANVGGANPKLTLERNGEWFQAGKPWTFDLFVPVMAERNTVVLTRTPNEALGHAAEWDSHIASILNDFVTLGLADRRQLRQLICDGPLLIGWLGGVGNRPAPHAAALLTVLADSVSRRILITQLLPGPSWRATALQHALEAIDAPAWVLDTHGVPQAMNHAGAVWWQAADHAARATLLQQSLEFQSGLRATAIHAPGGMPMWLVVGPRPAAFAAFVATLPLTPRQRDVCLLVVQGESNWVIAERLGLSERTVEIHVSRILAAAGVRTRVQLLARLRSD